MKKQDRRRKIFSISQEFEEEVNDILDNTPNISRYICEAIIEKHQRDANSDTMDKMLEEKVQSIVYSMDKMLEEKAQSIVYSMVTSPEMFAKLNIMANNLMPTNNMEKDDDSPLLTTAIEEELENSIKSTTDSNTSDTDVKESPTNVELKPNKEEITKDEVLSEELEDLGVEADTSEVNKTNNEVTKVAEIAKSAYNNW